MLVVEHQLKTLETCQAITAQVAGPDPATHLFICTGQIVIDAGRVVQRSGMVNQIPEAPLSFLIPDNNRKYLSLVAHDGRPLTILSSTAFAAFPVFDAGTIEVYRRIRGAQVRQQGSHALLVVNLWVHSHVDLALTYQVSILAGPAAG